MHVKQDRLQPVSRTCGKPRLGFRIAEEKPDMLNSIEILTERWTKSSILRFKKLAGHSAPPNLFGILKLTNFSDDIFVM